jgi:hypothetical protein
MKGEQPLSREESVGPALMIGFAAADAGALVLLAQDGAQAAADKAVEDAEQGRRGVRRLVHKTSLRALKEKVRAKTGRSRGDRLARIITDLNPLLRGWFGYFKRPASNR